MTPGENSRRPDRDLWQECQRADAPDDDTARFLDLAGYADRRLDPDEAERMAALLMRDPAMAADVAAARALTGMMNDDPLVARERMIARACALIAAPGLVVPFQPRSQRLPALQGLARWGGLAAAVALACWLGFAMGSDASLALGSPAQAGGDSGFLNEMLEPSSGFLRNLTDGSQT
jgi:anti-sigma factor RsiW